MSTFACHEPCPRCREGGRDKAGNNLARYVDGGGYCWSCQYHEPARGKTKVFNLIEIKKESQPPNDLIDHLPAENMQWLMDYDLTKEEIQENFKYSPHYQRHVYTSTVRPLVSTFQTGMKFMEGRSVLKGYIKTMSWGNKPYSLLGDWGNTGTVVIVEDIVSAIKLKRVYGVIPLFGSTIPNDILTSLSKFSTIDNVLVWLDRDKYEHAITIMNTIRLLNKDSCVIFTEKDPKAHKMEQIHAEVNNAVDFCIDP